MIKEVKEELKTLADDKYRDFHKKLCHTKYEILGVRQPMLRKIAKRIAKENWEEYILKSKNEVYEEIMLQSLIIGYAKIDISDIMKYLDIIIPKIDNWAICDSMCSSLKITKSNMEEMWKYILVKLNTEKEYSVRFSYVMMLNYYIKEEYLDKIFKIIDNNKQDKYYIKMAIAWLISCVYVEFPNETIKYLKNSKLDNFTYNKALQKILESNRVDLKDKGIIRNMKRY